MESDDGRDEKEAGLVMQPYAPRGTPRFYLLARARARANRARSLRRVSKSRRGSASRSEGIIVSNRLAINAVLLVSQSPTKTRREAHRVGNYRALIIHACLRRSTCKVIRGDTAISLSLSLSFSDARRNGDSIRDSSRNSHVCHA